MTGLPTPLEAGLSLLDCNREMNALVADYRKHQHDAAVAQRDATKAEAAAFLAADGPQDQRKWTARSDAAEQRFQADLAERLVDVTQKQIYALGRRMENLRTISATSRKELETLGAEL